MVCTTGEGKTYTHTHNSAVNKKEGKPQQSDF